MALLDEVNFFWGLDDAANEKILAQIQALPDDTEELNLRNRPLTSLADVKLPSGLRRLYLNSTNLKSLEGVALPQRLKRLYLNYTGLMSLEGVV